MVQFMGPLRRRSRRFPQPTGYSRQQWDGSGCHQQELGPVRDYYGLER